MKKYIFLKLLLLVLIISISSFFLKHYLNSYGVANVNLIGFFYIAILYVLAVYMGYKKFGLKFKDALQKKVKLGSVLHALLLIVSLGIFLKALFIPSVGKENFIYISKERPIYDLLFFLIIFLIPVLEELFYRKLICDLMIKTYSFNTTIFLSATLFMLVHILNGSGNLIAIYVGGFFLSYIYLKTKNLVLVILMHFTNNMLAYPTTILIGNLLESNSLVKEHFFMVYITILILFLLCIIYSVRHFKNYSLPNIKS